MESDLFSNRRLTRRLALLGAVSACLPVSVSAAEAAGEAVRLDPVVVVATRTPLPLGEASPSASYAGRAELERFQVRDLRDAIAREPGVFAPRSGATGAQTSVFTRGAESNHTAFFLNGRRLNPSFGGDFNVPALALNDASSVQLLRGPSSVLYGAEGIGGVVSLRTELPESGSSGLVEAERGSYDFARARLAVQGARAGLRGGLGASYLETDNARPNSRFERLSLMPQLAYEVGDNVELELLGRYADMENGLPGSRFANNLEDFQDTRTWLLSPGVRAEGADWRFSAFYSRSEERLIGLTGTGTPFRNNSRLDVESDEGSARLDWDARRDLLLSFGALLRRDDARRADRDSGAVPFDNAVTQVGGFIQGQYRLSERAEVRAGGRFDRFSDFDDKFTGSLEAVYRLGALEDSPVALFARVASAYAPPAPRDFAFSFEVPDLDPEESLGYEIGARQRVGGGALSWALVLFRNEIDELIDFDPQTFESFNLGEARTQGLEASVSARPTESVWLDFNYTYLEAEKRGGGVVFDPQGGDRLLRRPRHMANLALSVRPVEAATLSLEGRLVADRKDTDPRTFAAIEGEDYVVFRLAGEWRFGPRLSLIGRVENLFDENYEEVAGFPALGISGYAGLRAEF